MKPSAISVQRVYEGIGPDGSYRALVDRMWPRGLRRADLHLDEWARDIAPTQELCKWFSHIEERWDEFRARYQAELAAPEQQARMAALLDAAGDRPLTLLYGARNTEHNQAVVLRDALQDYVRHHRKRKT
ncbi:DUF488 family protein [Achromobacter insolitus]|jgi:uncharacterized protein YeaO (DUF488 family)|uniref:Uncharacterized protein n=1 Tax=Achromobacter insolitus TaxID=217204 RepID=A0A6S7FB36_9BURK|nr:MULTISPECIES: DUF488 family protein [Achromobacter]GLK94555.1 hypothetical protein GCM10008164_22930 [Achromobacter xylosoxidans]APX77647.1 hypothetical protein BUW96_24300 [Achromobacter insolitus]AVG42410.1 DUF488 domain-containing protein [Achromobacter insolitus]AXA73525.1 hypothetical protein CE205_24420 [Achromobacter insolitus]MCP1400075.1 uncharacterized protein YeaO (DUF488 family) [Achromobacter insolitus]